MRNDTSTRTRLDGLRRALTLIVPRLVLKWGNVSNRFELAPVIEPLVPFERDAFDGLSPVPSLQICDSFVGIASLVVGFRVRQGQLQVMAPAFRIAGVPK